MKFFDVELHYADPGPTDLWVARFLVPAESRAEAVALARGLVQQDRGAAFPELDRFRADLTIDAPGAQAPKRLL